MSRIFITGSSECLGSKAGQLLVEQGHRMVLHARNARRAADARDALPEAYGVVESDVTTSRVRGPWPGLPTRSDRSTR